MNQCIDGVDEIIDTQVVILGTGTAGCIAALKASEVVENIILVTKGRDIGIGGASLLATYPFSSCVMDSRSATAMGFPGQNKDNFDIFYNDIVKAGRALGNPQLIRSFVREIPPILQYLTSLGFRWDYSRLDQSGGHSFPRDCYGVKYHGIEFTRTMKKVLKAHERISVRSDMMILDILTGNQQVAGVTGLDLKTGAFVVIRAKSVVIATGGAQNIYPQVTTGKDLTGDGQAMAFRVGCQMINPEFVMFGPTIIWPLEIASSKGALLQLLRPHYRLYNAKKERFMEEVDPEKNEASHLALRAILREIQQGNGGEHGGIYCSIQHLSDTQLKRLATRTKYTNWVDPCTQFDFSPVIEAMRTQDFVEIGIVGHYFLGGLLIDLQCQTTLPGLYAAGECTGSMHGAARLGGMALSQCLVEGARAGTNAAEYAAARTRNPKIDHTQIQKSQLRAIKLLAREEGINPIRLRQKIQTLAMENVGLIRSGPNLQRAIHEIERIKQKDLPKLYVSTKSPVYNLEWIDAIQIQNILLNLEIIARAALFRTESRGAHIRSDFPLERNPAWQRNIIVSPSEDPPGVMDLMISPPGLG